MKKLLLLRIIVTNIHLVAIYFCKICKFLIPFGILTSVVLSILEGLGTISIGWFNTTLGFWVPLSAFGVMYYFCAFLLEQEFKIKKKFESMIK